MFHKYSWFTVSVGAFALPVTTYARIVQLQLGGNPTSAALGPAISTVAVVAFYGLQERSSRKRK